MKENLGFFFTSSGFKYFLVSPDSIKLFYFRFIFVFSSQLKPFRVVCLCTHYWWQKSRAIILWPSEDICTPVSKRIKLQNICPHTQSHTSFPANVLRNTKLTAFNLSPIPHCLTQTQPGRVNRSLSFLVPGRSLFMETF